MIEKKVKIIKILFQSDDNRYLVYKTRPLEDNSEDLVITGDIGQYGRGEILLVKGEPYDHPRFGSQLKILSHQICRPSDTSGIIKYLSSPRFKGIGPRTARKIADRFGDKAIDVVEKNPQKLLAIPGIPGKVIKRLKKMKQDHRLVRELQVTLLPLGLGIPTIRMIFDRFQEQSLGIIRENPYLLIGEIEGIGFRRADQIARAQGVEKEDRFRIRAGIHQAVNDFVNRKKSLGIPYPRLLTEARQLLDIPGNKVQKPINEMISGNELVTHGNEPVVLYPYRHFQMEKQSARKLLTILRYPDDTPIDTSGIDVDSFRPDKGMILSPEQKRALETTLESKITIISGGPGTGKTTLISILLKLFNEMTMEASIAAPTGRAAKRIFEATGFGARTIHRLLKINPRTSSFHYNRENPLPLDVLIVDEFSMVDSFLFFSLVSALPDTIRLILIGDKDQLPSVGPGNVLDDLLASRLFPSVFLQRNFRQQQDSSIIENAHRIKNGRELLIEPYTPEGDFVAVNIKSEEQALAKITGIMTHYQSLYAFNSFEYQILSPYYRGISGIDNINRVIQARYNPNPVLYKGENRLFKEQDKVMQTRNDYDKGVFNGELGIIKSRETGGQQIRIQFDCGLVNYTSAELDQIVPAYAVSIHKAQGSEFDLVVLLLLPHHRHFLKREIFYTGVTRARKKIILLSTRESIQKAIRTSLPVHRHTSLKQHLQTI